MTAQSPIIEKLPPFDAEAEAAVIASLLVAPEAMTSVAPILRPPDFWRDKNAWAYEACLALHERGEPINQVTVAHELSRRSVGANGTTRLDEIGGVAYLSRLIAELPTPIGVEHYARIVAGEAIRRSLAGLGAHITRAAYNGDGELGNLLADARTRFEAVQAAASPLLAAVGPTALTLDEVLCVAHSAPEWAADGLIVHGGLNIIGGDAESAKSWAGEDLMLAVATGQSWLGRKTRPGRGLVVDEENDLNLYGERLPGLLRGRRIMDETDNLRFLVQTGIDLSTETGMARLEAEIRAFDPSIVFLETLGMLRGRFDENSATDMSELTRRLQHLRSLNGHAQVLTHHLGKPGKVQRDLLRGSTQIRAAADSILEFSAMLPGGPFAVRHSKSRRARRQPNFSFAIEEHDGALALTALQAETAAGSYESLARDNLESLLADGEWHAQADILSGCCRAAPGATEETVRRGLTRAVAVLKADTRLEKKAVGRHVYLRSLP